DAPPPKPPAGAPVRAPPADAPQRAADGGHPGEGPPPASPPPANRQRRLPASPVARASAIKGDPSRSTHPPGTTSPEFLSWLFSPLSQRPARRRNKSSRRPR